MFRRFWPTKRVDRERHQRRSFRSTINCLIWYDVELVGLENWYLGFSKFWKFQKYSKKYLFYLFSKQNIPLKIKIKNVHILEGNGWWICVQTFKVDFVKNDWDMTIRTCLKQGTFHLISGLYRYFTNFIFWPILTLQKVFYRHFSSSLRKCGLKTCIRSSKSPDFFFYFFTWWPEMILTCDMVTKHRKTYRCQWLSMPIHWVCLLLTSKFY